MKKRVIALGFFDGVHIGHGALLKQTAQRARELSLIPAAFTFDRPPKEAVFGIPIPLINSAADRQMLMRRLYGMEDVLIAPFDRAMMTMSWEDFITELLVGQYHAAHLVAGHDFHFGNKNAGTPALLREKCGELGIGCDIIPPVEIGGTLVSSTYIRQLLEDGQIERANEFLGHPHVLSEAVTHGRRVGRSLGIPTVNFSAPQGVLLPRRGVYVTAVTLSDGRRFSGVTNVGCRPTLHNGGDVTVETFLLDFAGDLYGETLRLEFFHRLRDEMQFPSLPLLTAQVQSDIAAARAFFAEQK